MARTKRRKATHHKAARRNPARAHHHTTKRRRYRRNPPSVLKTLPSFAGGVLVGAFSATAGKVAVRKLTALAKMTPGGVSSMATQAVLALLGGVGLTMLGLHQIGRDFALGGVQSPTETALVRFKVPVIADALGDDQYYLGFSDGVDALAGNNLGEMGNYLPGVNQLGDVGDLGGGTAGGRFMQAVA